MQWCDPPLCLFVCLSVPCHERKKEMSFGCYRTLIINNILEVKPTSQVGPTTARSGRNRLGQPCPGSVSGAEHFFGM